MNSISTKMKKRYLLYIGYIQNKYSHQTKKGHLYMLENRIKLNHYKVKGLIWWVYCAFYDISLLYTLKLKCYQKNAINCEFIFKKISS